jgi:hypothetical protein
MALFPRPLYWQHHGLINCKHYKFTAVITPHTQEMTRDRASMTVGKLLQKHKIILPELWIRLEEDICHFVEVGNRFYLYIKKTWNVKRQRWELEFISLTPNRHSHTQRLRFAKPVW